MGDSRNVLGVGTRVVHLGLSSPVLAGEVGVVVLDDGVLADVLFLGRPDPCHPGLRKDQENRWVRLRDLAPLPGPLTEAEHRFVLGRAPGLTQEFQDWVRGIPRAERSENDEEDERMEHELPRVRLMDSARGDVVELLDPGARSGRLLVPWHNEDQVHQLLPAWLCPRLGGPPVPPVLRYIRAVDSVWVPRDVCLVSWDARREADGHLSVLLGLEEVRPLNTCQTC
jgi:hypothetical protein